MRTFNTAGPCDPRLHYLIPPERRLPEARALVEEGAYFVVHAPRQTGKTTTLRALARALTAEGRHAALHFSCEAARVALDDYGAAEAIILHEIASASAIELPERLRPPAWPEAPAGARLGSALARWSEACPRPLVLFFDEIDALQGLSLHSVLGQLRAAHGSRPSHAPSSVALCGLRDVRDYKAAAGGDPNRLGSSSPFNIKLESLRLDDFDAGEVRELFGQYSAETGRRIEPGALSLVFDLTRGQPWLVNALGREIAVKMAVPRGDAIDVEHVETAKERLVRARATHLDSLVARLAEPRVRRVVEPLLAGQTTRLDGAYNDDLQYVRDLGLIAREPPVRVANPIYREVVVRVLAEGAEYQVTVAPQRFVRADGTLDLGRLLDAFGTFWREHGEVLAGSLDYHEVAPQLVFMAFLQRVVNGGGLIDREYGVGRGRIDLLVRWPVIGSDGQRTWQREVIELKVRRPGRPDPIEGALSQLDAYLESLDLDRGTLVVFDRRPDAPPTETSEHRTPQGRRVHTRVLAAATNQVAA